MKKTLHQWGVQFPVPEHKALLNNSSTVTGLPKPYHCTTVYGNRMNTTLHDFFSTFFAINFTSDRQRLFRAQLSCFIG